MANETMRIFFPLKIFCYPQYDCSEDGREDISPREAVAYEDQILATIAKENRHFESDRGLAEYIHGEALKEKVYSLYPSVAAEAPAGLGLFQKDGSVSLFPMEKIMLGHC